MTVTSSVITAVDQQGLDRLGSKSLAIKLTDEQSIVEGSLLIVEDNQFCLLKCRGTILNVYDTGHYPLHRPEKALVGSFTHAFLSEHSLWAYDIIYVNRSKLLVRNTGKVTTAEMVDVTWQADYYINIDTKDDALALVRHMPFNGQAINADEICSYAGPVIQQSVSQIIQLIPLERVKESVAKLREAVEDDLSEFLETYGIMLHGLKMCLVPQDERMRQLISLRGFGLSPLEAVRYQLAFAMSAQGLVTAPNAAAGTGLNTLDQTVGLSSAEQRSGFSADSTAPRQ